MTALDVSTTTTRRSSRRALLVGLATTGLVLASCGTDDRKAPDSSGARTTSAAATGTACPASAGLHDPVSDRGAAVVSGTTLRIEAGDFFFAPTCALSVGAGTATLTVPNVGQALHNVSIPDQGIDVDVAPGQTISVQVKVSSTPVLYFCKYHRTSGMVGSLVPTDS